jgi:hypothetical protein
MTEYESLAKAISIATMAHEGQFDKGGKPYILHPLHLMNQLMFDVQLAVIAVLHDVVEDSLYTFDDLVAEGFSDRVLAALILLTHDKSSDYLDDYIPRICTNYDAIRVKRKDLEHNSDITRLKGILDEDLERLKKYHIAFTMLSAARVDFL